MFQDAGSWFNEYIKVFFTGDNLKNILTYMCNSCTYDVSDPVCSSLSMFLLNPVSFTVTNVGLVPFRSISVAVFPYNNMNSKQHAFIIESIAFIKEHGIGVTNSQMGGGVVLSLGKNVSLSHTLEPLSVIKTFVTAVLQHEEYQNIDVRLGICNVILQRLGATVQIPRDVLFQLHETVLKHHVEPGSTIHEETEPMETHAETELVTTS
jgi:hypothetical protein